MGLPNRKIDYVDRYTELVEEFPLKPIHNDRELGKAEKMLHSLLDREELNKDERDYLEVLGSLIERYETEHHPIEDVSNVEMLAHLIEAKGDGVTHRGIAEAAGLPESTVSDLLSGRREFNKNHIEKFAAYFHVSPAVFFKAQRPKTA
jgi:HTH-type transcriptional regulator / antitoxin HigA